MLLSVALLLQASLLVSALPLGETAAPATVDQSLLKDDPLKDFVSSVTQEATSAHKPRFTVQVNDIDDISVDNLHHRKMLAEAGAAAQHQDALLFRPSWFTSALMARRLLALSTIGVASTTYPADIPPHSSTPSEIAGLPISLPEYVADCEGELPDSNGSEGNPILLGLYVSTTFRNVFSGSNISLSIDWWDHVNNTEPLYPGFPLSPAGLPRLSLLGYIENFPKSTPKETSDVLESCFLASHPDAEAWLPGDPESPHAGFWAKMIVAHVHWIGGFGDTQQIGWINMTEWKGIRKSSSLPGIGDGRGWDDVRLLGEGDEKQEKN